MKEAGRIAVFRDPVAPKLVFQPADVLFWYSREKTVAFDPTGRFATLAEFQVQQRSGTWPPARSRTIDLERGSFILHAKAGPAGSEPAMPLDRLVLWRSRGRVLVDKNGQT